MKPSNQSFCFIDVYGKGSSMSYRVMVPRIPYSLFKHKYANNRIIDYEVISVCPDLP